MSKPMSVDSIVTKVLVKHKITRTQLKSTGLQGPKIRTAKNDAILNLYRAGHSYNVIGEVLNINARSVSSRLSLLRDAGEEVAIRVSWNAKKLPVLNGPTMVNKIGDRREDCIRTSECLKSLVRYHPNANHGSCPSGCGCYEAIPKDRVRSEAMRGEGAWATV